MVTPSPMRHMLGAFIGAYCLDIYNNLPLPNYVQQVREVSTIRN